MQGAVLTTRRRAFSQQALRRLEEVSNGRRASTVKPSTSKALELDGRSYLLPTLTLSKVSSKEAKDSQLFQARANRSTPVVLDLQQVSSDGSPHSQSIKKHELRNEIMQLQEAGYMPVGITNASEDVKKAAAALNLPYFIGTRLHSQQKAVVATVEEKADEVPTTSNNTFVEEEKSGVSVAAQTSAESLPPMVVSHSVRSGQQIFAQNRSLVVLGNVSSGAEVMADDDVVVLGALKGRALAGIGGNVRARIVCQSFDAELISIAHCFTTCDDLGQDETGSLQLHKPTAISLQDDRLHFESSTV
ncbi:septum site-determining protein MinC [Phytophthora nicotianae CJ01A1]|uniref:Septum site-determining protein MinC n=5 Tax=Phytophthora nicotianae TaxID=4792 RepID=V9FED2_PHYNI|nr:septum site-determining protein MinC [Phytophthora nicotianae P1569]ETK88674.1 septum site-determining protein MinC [Phytophthora nicotianae]ETO77509.1 septum site-determining protein MinC [Phytophthora nicotianae P1976]ETP18539.1 septum site-determining protein MinC [Phytophthora nicotianae CJ01A1]ETP46461.1 septum site-determining protein MinC [Phytophthora nicotianae P10297]KUF66929.1 septum site-determining protein MinC [Phytophthora nicotianae]